MRELLTYCMAAQRQGLLALSRPLVGVRASLRL